MKNSETSEIPEQLLWVKDAPLFIDEINLSRFYDAALRPPFDETSPLKLKITESTKKDLEGKFGAKLSAGLSNWLSAIASGSAEVSGEGKAAKSNTKASEGEIILQPIQNPHRQLEQLTIFYLIERREQLMFGESKDVLSWQKDGASLMVPRPLVFIDLPKSAKFIPMAAEFVNGKVVTFFQKLEADSGERPPPYKRENKAEYWKWFNARMVDRMSPPHAAMAWSTAASSPSASCVFGWEPEDMTLFQVDREGLCSYFVLMESSLSTRRFKPPWTLIGRIPSATPSKTPAA